MGLTRKSDFKIHSKIDGTCGIWFKQNFLFNWTVKNYNFFLNTEDYFFNKTNQKGHIVVAVYYIKYEMLSTV